MGADEAKEMGLKHSKEEVERYSRQNYKVGNDL